MPPSRTRRCLEGWALLCCLLLVRAFADGLLRAGRSQRPAAVPVVIDLNRATVGELTALPGIGPARAAAIVLHRVRHGPLRTVDELGAVDGIGAETLGAVRPFVCVRAHGDR